MAEPLDGEIICSYCTNKLAPLGARVWNAWTNEGVYRPHCWQEKKEFEKYL